MSSLFGVLFLANWDTPKLSQKVNISKFDQEYIQMKIYNIKSISIESP